MYKGSERPTAKSDEIDHRIPESDYFKAAHEHTLVMGIMLDQINDFIMTLEV